MAASPTVGDVEDSQQTGETAQVTASETSVLATHWTIENTWIS